MCLGRSPNLSGPGVPVLSADLSHFPVESCVLEGTRLRGTGSCPHTGGRPPSPGPARSQGARAGRPRGAPTALGEEGWPGSEPRAAGVQGGRRAEGEPRVLSSPPGPAQTRTRGPPAGTSWLCVLPVASTRSPFGRLRDDAAHPVGPRPTFAEGLSSPSVHAAARPSVWYCSTEPLCSGPACSLAQHCRPGLSHC